MPVPSIRRLALADLDETSLRRLIDHGENFFVERKRQLPKESGLGATVCSFANMLGGWLLLGVADDKTLHGFSFGARTDAQSHLGDLLRDQTDPLPAFVADERTLDGKSLVVVRVFESVDTPHIVRGTGAVYVRDSGGKQPVQNQMLLLELSHRGRDALESAYQRPAGYPILGLPYAAVEPGGAQVTVRACPVTVTP